MPLYECMLLFKPAVEKTSLIDLIARVGRHVYTRNGVLTDIKSFGQVQLGYGIRKLDGRHYQGQLMQITMMATPNINKELQYLNKEDRLLRWLLVKHRNVNIGKEEDEAEIRKFSNRSLYFRDSEEEEDESEDEDEDEDEERPN